jgi:hypothetical protein
MRVNYKKDFEPNQSHVLTHVHHLEACQKMYHMLPDQRKILTGYNRLRKEWALRNRSNAPGLMREEILHDNVTLDVSSHIN